MTTTLALARPRVRQGVTKSGGDPSQFSDFDIDFSIRTFGNDFINRTRCTRQIDTLGLVINQASVDFSSLTGFSPDMLTEFGAAVVVDSSYTATDVACGIEIVGLSDVREDQRRTCTGTPHKLAFSDLVTAQLFPTPKASGSLNVCWSPPLVDFVPGTQGAYASGVNYYLGDVVSSGGTLYSCIQSNTGNAPSSSPTYWTAVGSGSLTAPSAVTLNIPSHLIDGVLFFGAGYGLIAPSTDVAKGQGLMASYQSHVIASTGRGGLGAKSIQRSSITRR